MPPAGLIDTGAIVAALDLDDDWHFACVEALHALRLPLLTTEAVLTEVFHLVCTSAHNVEKAWKFVRSGAITVRTMDDADLPELHALMSRYKDRPMDFADATLVRLAERESMSTILTVDQNDFETYRIGGRKRFIVLPNRRS